MADIVSVISGIALVLLVWFDFGATALTASESGPISRRIAYGIWRAFVAVNSVVRSHAFLGAVGPLVIMILINAWVLAAWLGWSLIYLGGNPSVLDSMTKGPADASSVSYFVGFTLTTLGTGDYVPADGFWQLMTVIMSFSGLTLITLSITYAIPVVQAAATKRTVARQISLMGETVSEIASHWARDKEYQGVETYLAALTPQILDVAQKHLAYPILHYYHSPESGTALALKLAALDEAIRTLPDEAYEQNDALRVAEHNCSKAIESFLSTLNRAFIHPADEEPPQLLELALVKGVARQVRAGQASDALIKRRKLLKALVHQDGWSWDQIAKG